MKKIVFLLFIIFAFIGFISQAYSGYVRKKIKPNFFMPEEKNDQAEKLPSFPALEKGIIKVSDDGVILVKKTVTTYVPTKEEKELPVPTKKKQSRSYAEDKYTSKYTPDDGMGDDFSKSDRYLAMQEAYEKDLQTIAKTGEISQDEQLLEDLQKMDTNMPFVVK